MRRIKRRTVLQALAFLFPTASYALDEGDVGPNSCSKEESSKEEFSQSPHEDVTRDDATNSCRDPLSQVTSRSSDVTAARDVNNTTRTTESREQDSPLASSATRDDSPFHLVDPKELDLDPNHDLDDLARDVLGTDTPSQRTLYNPLQSLRTLGVTAGGFAIGGGGVFGLDGGFAISKDMRCWKEDLLVGVAGGAGIAPFGKGVDVGPATQLGDHVSVTVVGVGILPGIAGTYTPSSINPHTEGDSFSYSPGGIGAGAGVALDFQHTNCVPINLFK